MKKRKRRTTTTTAEKKSEWSVASSNSRITRDAAKYARRARERERERERTFHRSSLRSSHLWPRGSRRRRQGAIKRRSECVSPMIQGRRRTNERTNEPNKRTERTERNERTNDRHYCHFIAVACRAQFPEFPVNLPRPQTKPRTKMFNHSHQSRFAHHLCICIKSSIAMYYEQAPSLNYTTSPLSSSSDI